jgi:exodeoxyribonuclease VII small subunit
VSNAAEKFEQSMEKLEKIVEELGKGDFTLEESLQKFEEGLKLGKTCRAMLDKADARVKKLVEAENGEVAEEDAGDEFED